MYKVRYAVFDASSFVRDLQAVADKAVELTARRAPEDQARRIQARQTPDGSRQKANTREVAKRKRKELGHDIPLKETGHLADPSGYKVQRQGGDWVVRLPIGRRQVVNWLREKGYEYWEVSDQLRQYLADVLQVGVNNLRQNMSKYIHQVRPK